MGIRVGLWQIVEQVQYAALIERIIVCKYTAMSRRREPTSWNDNAVVGISAAGDRSTGGRIYAHRLRRVVKGRIEYRHVPPNAVVRNNDRLAQAVVNVQLRSNLPG